MHACTGKYGIKYFKNHERMFGFINRIEDNLATDHTEIRVTKLPYPRN